MTKPSLTKLFFVDDDRDILTVAKYCLKNLSGVAVEYLSSGEEAIERALQSPPDLILLDIMMPTMDGIATFKAIRLLPKISHIPIVFFTAKAQPKELEEYRKLGAFDVIIKPFDPINLPNLILSIWNRYQQG